MTQASWLKIRANVLAISHLPPVFSIMIKILNVAVAKRFKLYKPYQHQSMFLICQSFPQIQTWYKIFCSKDILNKHYTILTLSKRVTIFHCTKKTLSYMFQGNFLKTLGSALYNTFPHIWRVTCIYVHAFQAITYCNKILHSHKNKNNSIVQLFYFSFVCILPLKILLIISPLGASFKKWLQKLAMWSMNTWSSRAWVTNEP